MKKVLFATTALIATAGMAAADVRISGYGRFGLSYLERNKEIANADGTFGPGENGRSDTNITSRLRIQFDMSTETDGGVTLGARTRAESESRNNLGAGSSVGPNTAVFSGARFYASYGGFTLGVGNILGAIDAVPGMYLETRSAGTGIDGMGFWSNVGNVNNEFFNWDSYSSKGGGNNGIEVLYSAGGFAGHISYSEVNGSPGQTSLPTPAPVTGTNGGLNRERAAINVSYTFGDWTAALAYQDSNYLFEDKTFFAIYGDIGQFGVRFAYMDNEGIDKYGLYGNMDIGAASNLVVWVTQEDAVSASDVAQGRADNRDSSIGATCAAVCTGTEGTAYGINYSYDLGGGASFEAGAVQRSDDRTAVQAGVYFSF